MITTEITRIRNSSEEHNTSDMENKKTKKRKVKDDSSTEQVKQKKVKKSDLEPGAEKFIKKKKNITDASHKQSRKRKLRDSTNEENQAPKKVNLANRDAKKFALAQGKKVEKTAATGSEKPDWMEVKKQRKLLRAQRRERSNEEGLFQLSQNLKGMWEKLRNDKTSPAEREKLSKKIFDLIQGKIKKVVFAHDTVRVLECLMTQGVVPVRDGIFNEVKGELLELSKSKYGHFLVMKILRHGKKEHRSAIFKAFSGHAPSLLRHSIASAVLETAYNEYANATERHHIVQEFFDSEFKLFKDESVANLKDAINKNPEKGPVYLKNLRENIQPMIDKGILHHSLVHALIYEYMSQCSENERSEIVTVLWEHLAKMVHTRDGSRVAMLCVWNGNKKDRKNILKSLKGHVVKLCKEEHGHMVLLAVFDSVDDTVLVNKIILPEILDNVVELADHPYGRKVLLYLIAPRDRRHFHPHVTDILAHGDENPFSKKPAEQRRNELKDMVSKQLLEAVIANVESWMENSQQILFISTVLKYCKGDKLNDAFKSLAKLILQPFQPGSKNVIENAASHQMLKKLIENDKERATRNEELFSLAVLEEMGPDECKDWLACNRGAYLLVNMVETGVEEVKTKVLILVNKCKKKLTGDTSGKALLFKKLDLSNE